MAGGDAERADPGGALEYDSPPIRPKTGRAPVSPTGRGVAPDQRFRWWAPGDSNPDLERRVIPVEEVERLARAAGRRYAVLVRLLAYIGLRFGEARALRVGDLDLLRRRLSITRTMVEVNGGRILFSEPKTSASVRTVGIPESLVGPLAALCEGRSRADLVFTSPFGEPIRSRNFRARVWLPATKAVGLDGLTVHELRHTCVALLISQGVGPKQIQAQLGHEDVRTTLSIYGHLFPGHEDSTAAAMDAAIASARGWDVDGTVVPLDAARRP